MQAAGAIPEMGAARLGILESSNRGLVVRGVPVPGLGVKEAEHKGRKCSPLVEACLGLSKQARGETDRDQTQRKCSPFLVLGDVCEGVGLVISSQIGFQGR